MLKVALCKQVSPRVGVQLSSVGSMESAASVDSARPPAGAPKQDASSKSTASSRPANGHALLDKSLAGAHANPNGAIARSARPPVSSAAILAPSGGTF